MGAQLPTEAQWEYACRAGTVTPFSFGETITPERVNYDGTMPYAEGKKGGCQEKTVAVKALPANPWGLYEMHGNVWEWCADWYDDLSVMPIIDPLGSDTGSSRVLRGGSWSNYGWPRVLLTVAGTRLLTVTTTSGSGLPQVTFKPGRAAESHNRQKRSEQRWQRALRLYSSLLKNSLIRDRS